jgi:hypothetical protein
VADIWSKVGNLNFTPLSGRLRALALVLKVLKIMLSFEKLG